MNEKEYAVFGGKKSTRICGYCWKHHKFLTVKQIRQRKCISRGCGAIRKVSRHVYWKERCSRKEREAKNKVKELEFSV